VYEARLVLKQADGGNKTFYLDAVHGCYVSKIKGMTAVTANLSTAIRSSGVGETVRGMTIKGKPIIIEGYILDNNRIVKNDMLGVVKAGLSGTLYVMGAGRTGTPSKTEYAIDVVVRDSPNITQENHSKFSLTLYAPLPYWYNPTKVTEIGLTPSGRDLAYGGDTTTEYTLTVEHSFGNLEWVDFEWYGKLALVFDDPLPSHSVVVYTRLPNGRVQLTVDGVEHNECIDIENTTMWDIPALSQSELIKLNANSGIVLYHTQLEYYTRYASIMSWGVV
jgi:hypothetical protein